jgi:hypothetical protein
MARIHDTLTGHRIEYPEPEPKLEKFLKRAQALAEDPAASEDDLVALLYGRENPILDHTLFPTRGAVTREVLENTVYHVLTDLLARKSVQARKVDPDKLSRDYTLTVAQAAAEVGLTPDAIRKAIHSRKLPSWVKDGQYYLNPKHLSLLDGSKRGRLPGHIEPLDIAAGSGQGCQLLVRHPGGVFPPDDKGRSAHAAGAVERWRRVAVLTGNNGKARLFVIEPSDTEELITLQLYHVRGKFKIVEKINGSAAARKAWESFIPL